MKYKILAILFICFLSLTSFMQSPTYAATPADEVKIEDPVLEKTIRAELKLDANAKLDAQALERLTSLYPTGKEKIKSLKGLNKAVNLQGLFLANQEITDISPLSGLFKLTFLALNHNQIQNACPLAGLYQLQKLIISDNQIGDVRCLSPLTRLTDLLASNNHISSIAPLAKLKLGWLDISKNPVADLSPLNAVSMLHNLYVDKDTLNEESKALLPYLEQSGVAVNRASAVSDTTSGISVIVNEDRVLFEQSPVVDEGTTLVQFRPLFEKLGFHIQWDPDTRTIHAEKPGVQITLQVDSTNGTLNGKPYTLTVAPRNRDGSVFVPIRFVGEASQYVVTWISSTKTIYLVPTRTLTSPDELSKLTVGGKWLSKTSPAVIDSQLYFENGASALFTTTESKADLDKFNIKSLDEYENAVKKNLDPKLVTSFSDDKKLTINGLEARQVSYLFKASNGVTYSYIQTFIEGKYSYFRVILFTRDAVSAELNSDYQTTVQTFEEIKTPAQLSKEKFGGLTPTDRYLDAAHYYRNLGFFNMDKSLSSQEFDNKLLDIYRKLTDWNPFDSTKYYDASAELYMLELDDDRVWLEDVEADVAKGNHVYVDALKRWSEISRGAFNPSEITETWGTEEGPVTINFNLYGQKKELHPEFFYDYMDLGILKEINDMIKDSGYEFAAVQLDQEAFVTVLKAEEKQKLQQERYIDFVTLK